MTGDLVFEIRKSFSSGTCEARGSGVHSAVSALTPPMAAVRGGEGKHSEAEQLLASGHFRFLLFFRPLSSLW